MARALYDLDHIPLHDRSHLCGRFSPLRYRGRSSPTVSAEQKRMPYRASKSTSGVRSVDWSIEPLQDVRSSAHAN